jgi:hypothetical protein
MPYLDTLLNLELYQPVPKDASVVAWPVKHTTPVLVDPVRDMEFTIKAQVLKAIPNAAEPESKPAPSAETEESKKVTEEVKDEL